MNYPALKGEISFKCNEKPVKYVSRGIEDTPHTLFYGHVKRG